MAILKSYGQEIRSVFQLLGDKENDITSSICWALVKCPEFLKRIVKKVCGVEANPENVTILNQEYDKTTGITDIEVTDDQYFHIIFEAKRGWLLPGAEQLTKYSTRKDFAGKPVEHKHIVSLSECSQTYIFALWVAVRVAGPKNHRIISLSDMMDGSSQSTILKVIRSVRICTTSFLKCLTRYGRRNTLCILLVQQLFLLRRLKRVVVLSAAIVCGLCWIHC